MGIVRKLVRKSKFFVEFRIPYLGLIYYCFLNKDQISSAKMRLSPHRLLV